MNFIKLDKRMNGYGLFKYAVSMEFKEEKFVDIRNWLWETYGPSAELDLWDDKCSPNWSWDRGVYDKKYRCKIYLKSDEELVWLKTRWL